MKMKKYKIDFTNVKYYLEMHAVIKEALDFPDYYGCNWDAFWDCLRDMYGDPIHIEIVGFENIRKNFESAAEKMIKILKKFKHYINDMLAEEIKTAKTDATFVCGRYGHQKRSSKEIGIHALRMGGVIGEHEVILATPTETISLKHEAHTRALFADGALVAAEFLVGKPAGFYTMKDIVGK